MVLWLGEIFDIIKSVLILTVFFVASVVVVRFTLVVAFESGEPLQPVEWVHSDEMRDWTNWDYWKKAIVYTLGGWVVFIGGVVLLVCIGNGCGLFAPCLAKCCCSNERKYADYAKYHQAPPLQLQQQPPMVQLVLQPPPRKAGAADAIVSQPALPVNATDRPNE